jgi:hypothetical protein
MATEKITAIPLKDTCLVCDRPGLWGDIQRLGNGYWRHEECKPGSATWKMYYGSRIRRSDTGEFLK